MLSTTTAALAKPGCATIVARINHLRAPRLVAPGVTAPGMIFGAAYESPIVTGPGKQGTVVPEGHVLSSMWFQLDETLAAAAKLLPGEEPRATGNLVLGAGLCTTDCLPAGPPVVWSESPLIAHRRTSWPVATEDHRPSMVPIASGNSHPAAGARRPGRLYA